MLPMEVLVQHGHDGLANMEALGIVWRTTFVVWCFSSHRRAFASLGTSMGA